MKLAEISPFFRILYSGLYVFLAKFYFHLNFTHFAVTEMGQCIHLFKLLIFNINSQIFFSLL